MEKLVKNNWLGPSVSGVLSFLAICQFNQILNWVCFIPLFISISNAPRSVTFKKGLIYGCVFSVFSFSWMIVGAERFTGQSIFYGVGVFLISTFIYSLFPGLVLFLISLLKRREKDIRSVFINSILVAAAFCTAVAAWRLVSTPFPWFDFHPGNALAANIYTIQPASIFGIHILTFITLAVNYLLAVIVERKMWSNWYLPVLITAAYFVAGFALYKNFDNKPNTGKAFDVAILSENILPDIKWDDQNGNRLVQKLLDLNKAASIQKPQIALWSESAIPWTYSKEDDLVKEILNVTAPANITHILGINTEYQENWIFNSAYSIAPDGTLYGRYDKQHLLALIESPWNGLLIPFFSNKGFFVKKDTAFNAPITTPYGKAGILICNEAALPAATADMVNKGAQFLVNISNDGWFNDTYIVTAHFYYARMRAVESRKDIVVNCNNGYSGLINASGEIIAKEKSEEPFVKMVSVQPNDIITTATTSPHLFVYCCAAWLTMMAAMVLLGKYKSKSSKR